jgi:DNA-binding response OmpR family regulator
MSILLVEDDRKLSAVIKKSLKEVDQAVDISENGDDALSVATSHPYDLIILDIMLPGKDGISVCRTLRKNRNDTPILILTARDDEEDKIAGLDSGADDYMTKPFSFPELLARIRALLRRKNIERPSCLKTADLELHQLTHKVYRAGKEIELTPTEYTLLEYFMLNAGAIVTRTMLSEHVWHGDYDAFSNVINVYVNYLKKKIDYGHPKQLLHSLRGVGYTLKEN